MLEAPVCRTVGIKRTLECLRSDSCHGRRRKGGKQVVDHVDAPEVGTQMHLVARSDAGGIELDTGTPCMDIRCLVVKRRACESALRASESTKLSIGMVVVDKLGSAYLAEGTLRDALRRQMQVFCNAEGKHLRARLSYTAGHAHADGVVAADKQRRFGRRCQCTHDRILHTVDLPFAIELVAEEVQKDLELWLELRHDVHGAELICLDDAPVGARSRQKCSHDAWCHVRASTVAEHTLSSCLDSGGDDVVRGRLAVRAADDDGALLQLLGEARDDIGIDGQGNASRQLRSVAPEHRAETPVG